MPPRANNRNARTGVQNLGITGIKHLRGSILPLDVVDSADQDFKLSRQVPGVHLSRRGLDSSWPLSALGNGFGDFVSRRAQPQRLCMRLAGLDPAPAGRTRVCSRPLMLNAYLLGSTATQAVCLSDVRGAC